MAEACRTLAHLVGPAALRAFGLPMHTLERFTTALTLCGWIQDMGKGNSHFQEMLANGTRRQLLRHEIVSGLLVWYHLRDWLAPLGDVLVPALWAALGHHRKVGPSVRIEQVDELTVYLGHPDMAELLADMAYDLGLSSPPPLAQELHIGRDIDKGGLRVPRCTSDMLRDFRQCESHFTDPAPRRELALLKSFGIAADMAASAIPKHGEQDARYSVGEIITNRMESGVTPDDLDELIRSWSWKVVANSDMSKVPDKMPPGFILRPFQEAVADSESPLTLAEAGCGSGKSLAAYLWAKAWCRRRESGGYGPQQLFVCLPTTGTTTEHFKDYALELGVRAELAHSRAAVDIAEIYRTSPTEDTEDEHMSAEEAEVRAERQKIEAIALWGVPVVASTADTVLGAMANGLKALCTFPAVVRSLLVFDEIHAFDERLFGHLLVFLRHAVGIPILLMTASLPENRRLAIAAVRPDLHCVPGPSDLQTLERYHLASPGQEDDPWDAVERCLARGRKGGKGGKVLWVRNRVDWANETYEQARRRLQNASVHVYHSRLRYRDRTRRHRAVIDEFKRQDGRPVLLVSTQVAEMSLDLSADLLVTDLAPIPALIQRLGRLNRRATPKDPGAPKTALICSVAEAPPYARDELDQALRWAQELAALGRPLSQDDLAEHFARFDNSPVVNIDVAERNAGLIGVPGEAGLWRTEPGQTRASGYTASVILQEDLDAFRRSEKRWVPPKQWLREHEVAIPIRRSMHGWPRIAAVPVAPEDEVVYDYDPDSGDGTGARWRAN